ncbi:hypothetical protein [Streptomyces sp. VRA16 Mangrove soil]|uniref:hypothetical protein n=1 Tax=Streptomyces sp. VRA16 Mangrove soil TaxID=2817434 RepID=UPI001A9CE23F|nr:hypothetical protein [Streptomyces sp. VRA16 Mangrove soil]MBO1337249.1 hypothetical protein [Streptomyces sp. VRA16 Mangrove soil]
MTGLVDAVSLVGDLFLECGDIDGDIAHLPDNAVYLACELLYRCPVACAVHGRSSPCGRQPMLVRVEAG